MNDQSKPVADLGAIYAEAQLHLQGFEEALSDAVAALEAEGDRMTAARVTGLLRATQRLHKRAQRIAEDKMGSDVVVAIGGGK